MLKILFYFSLLNAGIFLCEKDGPTYKHDHGMTMTLSMGGKYSCCVTAEVSTGALKLNLIHYYGEGNSGSTFDVSSE